MCWYFLDQIHLSQYVGKYSEPFLVYLLPGQRSEEDEKGLRTAAVERHTQPQHTPQAAVGGGG